MRNKLNYNINWGEYFRIDSISPSGLVRIKNRVGRDIEKYNVGTKAFKKDGKPDTWRLGFKNKSYQVHRIIWALKNGSIDPKLIIDHLDGNPFNNHVGNLSLKPPEDNMRNMRVNRNNKTGTTGVMLTAKDNERYYYVAHWHELDGREGRKHFSISKFGEETAKALAITYREEQIRRLISEGAAYTERHGI